MLTIKPMTKELKSETLDMIVDFYSGPAVDHQVERKVLEQTFEDAISGKYPWKAICFMMMKNWRDLLICPGIMPVKSAGLMLCLRSCI